MKILHLTLHKKWFDEIASGSKVFEYREIKPYWTKRLMDGDKFKDFDGIYFVNGYGSHRPNMRVEFAGISYGTFHGEQVYAIRLGKVFWTRNYP
jgi:hypothetical protein